MGEGGFKKWKAEAAKLLGVCQIPRGEKKFQAEVAACTEPRGLEGDWSSPERQAHLADCKYVGQEAGRSWTRTQSCFMRMLPHRTRGFCRQWGAVKST